MRILYISNEYPPETGFGGIGTYTKHAAEGMAARGHSVFVLARSLAARYQYIKNGVTVIRIPPGRFPLPEANFYYPFRKLCYGLLPHSLVRMAWANAVRDAVKSLHDNNECFDIIEYPECGAEGLGIERLSGELIARLHTPWHVIRKFDRIREPAGDHVLLPALEKKSVLRASLVTCPSEALARICTQQWGCKKIRVINNPIPSDQYSRTSGGGWIYTGRIERRKGIHVLIEAYAALCKTHSPPDLKLIGRPYGELKNGSSYGEWIRGMIKQYSLQNKVEWTEGIPLDEVRGHLLSSSVAFFPSLWENFSYAGLEAMACGLAVIASDHGGYREMMENKKSGLLFKAGSVEDLLGAMRRIIENPDLEKKLGENAIVRVKNAFDTAKICGSMEKIYEEVVRERN